MHITLTLTSSTTVRMIASVHSHTTHSRPNIQPSASPSLSELSVMPCGIARHANRRGGIFLHPSNLSTLQPDDDRIRARVARDDGGMGASGPAEDGGTLFGGSDGVDNGSDRNHLQRQTIPSPSRLCRQHTRIDNTAHGRQKLLWDPASVALHRVPRAQSIRRKDVAFPLRSNVGDKRDMCGSAGVAFNAVDDVWAGLGAEEVDGSDTALVPASAVAHDYAAGVVAASFAVAFFGEGEGFVGFTFPEVFVDGADEMADTGSAGFVALPNGRSVEWGGGAGGVEGHGEGFLIAVRRWGELLESRGFGFAGGVGGGDNRDVWDCGGIAGVLRWGTEAKRKPC
jgi:hypothetical protein